MARAELSATPKVRSRKDGAAVALDDARPPAAEPDAGELPDRAAALRRGRGGRRVQRGRGARPGRRAARASGSSARSRRSTTPGRSATPRCWWRPRSTPRTPGAPPKIINSHPGVSHNYLRNHEFNMWFTLAVERDSQLGLDGTLDVLAGLTGAESIRQLPTLKLFKIRMDLEMEGDTEGALLAGRGDDSGAARGGRLRRARRRRDPRDAGRHAGRARALRAGRGASSG